MSDILIRRAVTADLPFMVSLSREKRLQYEKAQPQFWRHADDAEEMQLQWFGELLHNDQYILLVAEAVEKVDGFIIGQFITAPPVYQPGGLTLMIDDFCVSDDVLWPAVGGRLISEINSISRKKNVVQLLVTCGAHDQSKKQFLDELGLSVASEWYVGNISL